MDYIFRNNQIYFESAKMYPQDHRGVKWGSAESQFLRFKILCDISPDIFNGSILDVGCGFGHLVDYFLENDFKGTYKGIDLSGEMILNAQKRHPAYHFEVNDIESIEPESYDYVLASGIFAFSDWAHTTQNIKRLFARAKKGLAFNCLSTLEQIQDPYLTYYDPAQLLNFCQTISPKAMVREDYLSNDFTIYLRSLV